MNETCINLNCYHLVNYIKIIDLSLLNLIDCSEVLDNFSLLNDARDKFIINFDNRTKELLEGLIVSNLNAEISKGGKTVIINTCNPMKNWRQLKRKRALRVNKYILIDKAVYIDQIKLNAFANKVFKNLPKRQSIMIKQIKDGFGNIGTIKEKISLTLNKNVKFLEFDNIDILDTYSIISNVLKRFGTIDNLSSENFNYMLLQDGNHNYEHDYDILQDVKNDVKLKLLNQEII